MWLCAPLFSVLFLCWVIAVMKWTEDKGHHWEEAKMTEPGDWLAQPTVTRLTNGTLLGFHRDRQGMYLYSTMSNDEGRTWTKPKKTRVPNNNSGIQVTTLKSGAFFFERVRIFHWIAAILHHMMSERGFLYCDTQCLF